MRSSNYSPHFGTPFSFITQLGKVQISSISFCTPFINLKHIVHVCITEIFLSRKKTDFDERNKASKIYFLIAHSRVTDSGLSFLTIFRILHFSVVVNRVQINSAKPVVFDSGNDVLSFSILTFTSTFYSIYEYVYQAVRISHIM